MYMISKPKEKTTERLDAITVKRAIIDQSPPCAVYRLMIEVRRPANAFRSVGLVRNQQMSREIK